MEPEIARRCLNCGASVRGRAHFCPQCGRPMGEEAGPAARDVSAARGAVSSEAVAHPLAAEAERVAASLSGRLADLPAAEAEGPPDNHVRERVLEDDAPLPPVLTPETTRPADATQGELQEVAAEADDVRGADDVRAGGDADARSVEPRGGVRGRAAAVGASVGESLKPRVDRLREASSVVIDEATDDPGVRFLVIAVVLFLLFLLLWLLSFTLG